MDTTPFIAQSWPYKIISIGYIFAKHAGNYFFLLYIIRLSVGYNRSENCSRYWWKPVFSDSAIASQNHFSSFVIYDYAIACLWCDADGMMAVEQSTLFRPCNSRPKLTSNLRKNGSSKQVETTCRLNFYDLYWFCVILFLNCFYPRATFLTSCGSR